MSDVSEALAIVGRKTARGLPLAEAVRELVNENPWLVASAQEDLGSYPASEAPARALQNVSVPRFR